MKFFVLNKNINNITGFMIKAIQEGYQNISGKIQKELTDYGDIEELESRILENGNYKQQTLI